MSDDRETVGFICSTPYNVFLCLVLATTIFRNEKKILMLYGVSESMNKIYQFSKTSVVVQSVFQDVILYSEIYKQSRFKEKLARRIHRFVLYRDLRLNIKKYHFTKCIFSFIDVQQFALIIKYILKQSPKCQFYYSEDGLGNYTGIKIYHPQTLKGRLFMWILRREQYLREIKGIYMTSPSLLTFDLPYPVLQIPSLRQSNIILMKMLYAVFDVSTFPDCDLLFLVSWYKESGYTSVAHIQDALVKNIGMTYASYKMYMKLHPRTKYIPDAPNMSVIDASVMFELSIGNCDISRSILISIDSTACFTPFMLWGQIPTIILLYKLCREYPLTGGVTKFIPKFQEVYREHGGRIYIPETVDEMHGILRRELEQLHHEPAK